MPKDTRYGSIIVDKDIHNVKWVSIKNVLNASDNLIDLIEEGDYVNGKEVTEVMRDKNGNVTDIAYTEEVEGQSYSLLPIKDIVTKEQFDSVKYEVK